MRRTLAAASFLACAFSTGCPTSIRVIGVVTDAATAEPVGTCEITMGARYTHSDPAGRYSMVARRSTRDGNRQRVLNFACRGYEPASITVNGWGDRYPTVNLQVVPLAKPAPEVCPDPRCQCRCPK